MTVTAGPAVAHPERAGRRLTGWDAGVLLAANAVAVTGLWWRQGGVGEVHDLAGALTSASRLTGLLGALLALVMLLLLARVPVLDGLALDRVAAWHRGRNARTVAGGGRRARRAGTSSSPSGASLNLELS